MNGWLLDTNVVAELARSTGDSKVVTWARAQDEDRVFISVLTLAEFDKGIHNLPPGGAARRRIEESVVALEARFAGRVLPLESAIVRRWGRISGDVRRATGRAPPVVDTLLAATAVERNLVLATRNIRDVLETGAVLFDPWTDDPRAFAFD